MAPPRAIETNHEKLCKQGSFCKWANFKGTGGGLETPKPEELAQVNGALVNFRSEVPARPILKPADAGICN